MSFRILGLPASPFAELFSLDDAQLATRGARRSLAQSDSGYPCRISLTDAARGDEVLLVNYEHQPADSPYRSRHAIYVRRNEQTYDAIDQVPEQLRRRMLSVRGFDADGMMTEADLIDGPELEAAIERFFQNERTHYLHVHFAKPGCYAARIERV
ncbi:MAG TPA: DUF1203 domain-containing protein [Dokdonella sp.]